MATAASNGESLNAVPPILVADGRLTLVRALQFENAPISMLVANGRFTLVRAAQ
ncbi:hypothetical protein FACS1894204_13870 [Synergistales bacterium]|nr:hypothetical protein FACS1894204_13870 [Synergistales bacterium]